MGLVLCNVLVNFVRTHDMPWLDSREQYLADIEETTRAWAEPDMWDEMLQLTGPSLETRDDRIAFSRPIRLSVSPGNMANTSERTRTPMCGNPSIGPRAHLVICRALPERAIALTAPYVVERIPAARLARVDGNDAIPMLGDREPMQDQIRRFLQEIEEGVAEEQDRILATVLFTDIVGSTARAAELGDRGWRELLNAHHGRVRRSCRVSAAARSIRQATGSSRPSTGRLARSVAPAQRSSPSVTSGSRSARASIPVSARSSKGRSAGSPSTSARVCPPRPVRGSARL